LRSYSERGGFGIVAQETRTFRRAVAAAVAMALIAAAPRGAHADTAKEQELEARIQQLEKLVKELTEKQAAQDAAQGGSAVAATPPPPPPATPAAAKPAIQSSPILPNALANTRFLFTGYAKLDSMWSKYDDGEIADGTVGRDFFVPGTIPIGGASEDADLDAHVKQTRLQFGTDTDLENGEKLSARFEVDFYGSALGDERATNTYGVILRHAYIQYRKWLVGQTWSTFQDSNTLPETADYIGPTDGTVFVRQPQVRYTSGPWSLAVENPETTITPFGGGTRISSDDNNVPDFVAAYNFKLATGYLRLAGLARQLKLQTTGAGAIDDSEFAAALSLAGKFNFGKNDLRFMLTSGDAIGRYIGLNFNNDVVLTNTGELENISGTAGFVAWHHVLNDKLRANLMYSASEYDNDIAFTGTGANKSSHSWAVNAFYSPISKLDLGLEFRYAARELESGADGSMKRLQGVVKYSF
jgi:DcaP outer membrane protein